MAGTELPGDPLALLLGTLVPWVYLKKDDSFNCSLPMALCVTSYCKKKGLDCYRGLVGSNFGIDLEWIKMLYAARQWLIQFLPRWMLVFRVSQAGSFIKQHQTDVPHRAPAVLAGDLLCQTLVRGHGHSFCAGGIL